MIDAFLLAIYSYYATDSMYNYIIATVTRITLLEVDIRDFLPDLLS